MSLTVLIVVIFGFLVIVGLFIFGISKLPRNWKELVFIFAHEHKMPCTDVDSCRAIQEIDADYLSRRNELLLGLAPGIVITATITFLAVLLLEEKIPSEAALPIMSALGCIGFGKVAATIKSAMPKNPSPTEKKKDG